MNELHQQFQILRQEALLEAKEVLGKVLRIKSRKGKCSFDPARSSRYKSIMHQLMDLKEIEYRINNNLPIDDLYERDGSKFQRDKNVQEVQDGEELE